MNILVACEESQRVCIAFREKGHNAYSCDIIDCSGGHPEWHIKHDVLDILEPKNDGESKLICFSTMDDQMHIIEKWDMIIAFPPCTHLAVSGARWFEKKREDGRQAEGIEFFGKILNCNCERIVVENPINIISGEYMEKWFPDLCKKYNFPCNPTQRIQPWQFGDPYEKTTCLWIRGLSKLISNIIEEPELDWVEWIDSKTGRKKRQQRWYYEAFKLPPDERAKVRSKTFPGVAKAMAEQWG